MKRKRLARMGLGELLSVISLMIMFTGAGSQHTRDRGDKTRGVNGGEALFDTRSGEFRRYRDSAEVEIIRRTPVRTLRNGEVVNKVLKRRKKYRLLPRRIDADQPVDASGDNDDNSDDKPQLREINASFEKLKPLKTKYKTSDSIRMHVKTPYQEKNISRASAITQHENKRNILIERNSKDMQIKRTELKKQPIELSNNFKFKQKIKKKMLKKNKTNHYDEQIGAESREHKTFKRLYERNGEVLVASGDHNSLSIQEPVHNTVTEDMYDFTIGRGQRLYPTTPSPYKQYPGLYFPPTDSSEDRNPLKNYDFIIGDDEVKGPANPVLKYLNLSPMDPRRPPTSPAPQRRPPVPGSTQSSTSHQPPASTTKASWRSHTTQRIPATGLRFPHFPSIEVTGNYIDSRNYEKKLFTTTPRPRQVDYNIHPVHKYQHFDTFPPSLGQDYNSLSAGSSKAKHSNPETDRSKNVLTRQATPSSYHAVAEARRTTTPGTVSSHASNNKNNFLVDWGMKVDNIDEVTRRQEMQVGQFSRTTAKPKRKVPPDDQLRNQRYPGAYNMQYPKTDLTTTARYDNSLYMTTTPRNQPHYRAGPSYAPATVATFLPTTPAPLLYDRAHYPAQSPPMSSFYTDYRAFYSGQHPKPYQPAITFLDSMEPFQDANRRYSLSSQTSRPRESNAVYGNRDSFPQQQQKGPTLRPGLYHKDLHEKQGHQGPTHGPENIPSVKKAKNKLSSFNYDPFAFNSQQQKSQLPEAREGFENETNFVDFRLNKKNSQSRNSQVGGAERGKSAQPNRPDDTKYSLSVDPRQLFDNFHVSDKFSVYSNINDNFTPAALTEGARSYHGETIKSDNARKFDFKKEKRNLNTNGNKETENILTLRSKLFDGREPGGYYIKVFNNDGNNYSIRDGKIPRNEADGQHNVGSHNKIKSGNHSQSMNRDQLLWPGSRPGVSTPVLAQNRVWRNDKQWNQHFESRGFSQQFPFISEQQPTV